MQPSPISAKVLLLLGNYDIRLLWKGGKCKVKSRKVEK